MCDDIFNRFRKSDAAPLQTQIDQIKSVRTSHNRKYIVRRRRRYHFIITFGFGYDKMWRVARLLHREQNKL